MNPFPKEKKVKKPSPIFFRVEPEADAMLRGLMKKHKVKGRGRAARELFLLGLHVALNEKGGARHGMAKA